MKRCFSCNMPLPEDTTYCSSCGADQRFESFKSEVKRDDTFLKVLCILTIVGASIGIVSSAVALPAMHVLDGGLQLIVMVEILAIIGKLTGAIIMLQKRLTGLYIYTVASVASILLSIVTTVMYTSSMAGGLGVVSAVIGLIFAIGFLVMYWLPQNKNVLS